MDRFDPFVKYADVYGDIINWEKDPMNKPQNQNKYFFSDGKTYYEQICKMLRLMSVFKEAFNQIYSNEDEISEAWENFVNNLSASVVEGSEPDVTLTWTDDSVNFEFTMVPGVPGEQGVGITSISFNSDYTMTITLSDGNSYTSMSLKGETGPQGPQGETGSGLQILDVYATLADLQSAHPTGQPGDAYQVGSGGNYILYIWSSSQSAWVQAGTLGTVSPYTSAPLMDGTASAGSQNLYARGDHVHPSDTSRASKEELDTLIRTSQTLIDQSFTYRESPAIQDGLARIDKIKGNTLRWNQLVQNGNFADTSKWSETRGTISASSNVLSYTISEVGSSIMNRIQNNNASLIQNHKYLMAFDIKPLYTNNIYCFSVTSTYGVNTVATLTPSSANTWNRMSCIFTNSMPDMLGVGVAFECSTNYALNDVIQLRNYVLFDLTQMGLDITDPSDFTSLFPLSYYAYNQGSLLSFMGNGIKTVGKNLCPKFTDGTGANLTYMVGDDGSVKVTGTNTGTAFYAIQFTLPAGTYVLSGAPTNGQFTIRNAQGGGAPSSEFSGQLDDYGSGATFTVSATATAWLNIRSTARTHDDTYYPMIRYADADDTYEPYTSSTLSLPISTYFPTGMKSTGSVYDELTPTKAITRIGAVDLGTLTFSDNGAITGGRQFITAISNKAYGQLNITSAKFIVSTSTSDLWTMRGRDNSNSVAFNVPYTTVEEMQSAMNGVYLYYELATSAETAVDLDLSFNVYENGTEQLLPVNGSVPSTSPIIADMSYLSIDDAMEYIIDKLANVPQNTQQILESLEDDVADLQTDTGALQTSVSGLQTSVGNINTNIGQISSTVAGHTASISDMQSDITDLNTGLSNLEDTVTDNTSRIGTLESGLSATNGNVQNLETSVSDLDDTVTAQGTTVTALDSIISDISNNPVVSALGSHELGFVAAYVEATLAANTGTKVTIPKPVIFPNNYTPLFIVGMSTGSSDVSICEIPPTFGSRDSVSCRVWNHGSQQTVQVTVYILCMRQRQSQ